MGRVVLVRAGVQGVQAGGGRALCACQLVARQAAKCLRQVAHNPGKYPSMHAFAYSPCYPVRCIVLYLPSNGTYLIMFVAHRPRTWSIDASSPALRPAALAYSARVAPSTTPRGG